MTVTSERARTVGAALTVIGLHHTGALDRHPQRYGEHASAFLAASFR